MKPLTSRNFSGVIVLMLSVYSVIMAQPAGPGGDPGGGGALPVGVPLDGGVLGILLGAGVLYAVVKIRRNVTRTGDGKKADTER